MRQYPPKQLLDHNRPKEHHSEIWNRLGYGLLATNLQYANGVETVGSASSAHSRSEEESIIPHESPDRYRLFPGVQYCLAIDGARIAETTVGGLDAGNDQYGDSYALWHAAGATDMIFPISAGNRTITLEARVPMANTNHPQFSSDHCFYTIASRELIILEMY